MDFNRAFNGGMEFSTSGDPKAGLEILNRLVDWVFKLEEIIPLVDSSQSETIKDFLIQLLHELDESNHSRLFLKMTRPLDEDRNLAIQTHKVIDFAKERLEIFNDIISLLESLSHLSFSNELESLNVENKSAKQRISKRLSQLLNKVLYNEENSTYTLLRQFAKSVQLLSLSLTQGKREERLLQMQKGNTSEAEFANKVLQLANEGFELYSFACNFDSGARWPKIKTKINEITFRS